ncbi:MAG: sulfatase [Candidatus Aminicenantes bacterium]|nr:sulfatase [Candidatus Aminicenantes bacterium]
MKNHNLRRFQRTLFPVLVLAVLSVPVCRPKSESNPVAYRFIDGLTNAGVVESPLKNPETAGLGDRAYPVNSSVMAETGSGEAAFGLKRKLNLGLMETDILFAPPWSEFKYRLPIKTEGVLDFGIGIVRDAHAAARSAGAENPSGGVKFMVILETGGRKKVLFERLLKQPEARKSRTINHVRQRIPLPARKGEATLTLVTSGASDAFAYWEHPVFYVPEKTPLNIILISVDTLRADHVGTYGYDKPVTPRIDALAADGVVFENVYSTAPWTLPAHVSMFTGLNCVQHRVYSEHDRMDPRTTTLAEIMRGRGYATRAITSGGFVSSIFGFSKGFDEYHMDQADMMDASQAAKTGYDAAQWIEKNADRSFFLFLHTYQVHSPYKSPKPYQTMFLRPDAPWTRVDVTNILGGQGGVYKPLSESERANMIALYDGGIRFTDETLVQHVVDALRRHKLYDRTMIIVTSDHGEEFYDHGGWTHSHSVYDEIIRVPLVIKMPGSECRGRRYSSIVRLIDLMPTVLDVAGIPSEELSINGESLRPVLRGKETGDRVFLAELAENILNCQIPQRLALNYGRRKVILNRAFTPEQLEFFTAKPPSFPPVELYDLARDPGEQKNVIDRPEDAAKVRALVQKARETDRLIPRREGKESKIDKNLEDQLRALGYIR